MRLRIVLLALLAAAGCERLLALEPVNARDAGGDAPPGLDATPGDGSGVNPCSAPFAYYQFENPSYLADSSGNHYDGTLLVPAPIVEAGEQGRAYKFDGTDNVAELDYAVFQVTPLTVSLWFSPTAVTDGACLINQVSKSGSAYGDAWQLCFQSGDLVMYMEGVALAGGSASADTWQHAVVELDGTPATLWLDGTSSSLAAAPQYDGSSPIVIGADQDSVVSYDAFYGGGIDELEFFHCAVPADQLGNL